MALAIEPDRTALLVIDMQNAFCHADGTLARDGTNIDDIRGMIGTLRDTIRRCQDVGIQDFWSLQEHYADDAARSRHRIRPHTLKRFQVPCLRGTWDAQFIEELQPLMNEKSEVFTKNRFGCFYNTTLETLLRIYGIDTVVVGGVTTNACVETTIREAYLRDYDVVALRDCIAGVNPAWHDVALEVWQRFVGAVVTSEELLDAVPHDPRRDDRAANQA